MDYGFLPIVENVPHGLGPNIDHPPTFPFGISSFAITYGSKVSLTAMSIKILRDFRSFFHV